MKVVITKKASKKPLVLQNGDKYDGLFEIFDDNNNKIFECNCNTDPTANYKGGEIACGEYIYKKRIRANGKVVFDILDKETKSNILPSEKENPNHRNKKIIQYVQIHCGGISWDGSYGCITIHPNDWQMVKNLLKENGVVVIKKIEKNEKKFD